MISQGQGVSEKSAASSSDGTQVDAILTTMEYFQLLRLSTVHLGDCKRDEPSERRRARGFYIQQSNKMRHQRGVSNGFY